MAFYLLGGYDLTLLAPTAYMNLKVIFITNVLFIGHSFNKKKFNNVEFLEKFYNVVILSDSKAAVQAIASSEALASADILHCRQALHRLDQHNKNAAMLWVPAHCGLQGNETADFLARKAAKILQISPKPVPFYTSKRLIKISLRTTFEAKLQEANKDKDWLVGIKDIPSWPREKSMALFRLATGHDCL
ncbi:uncharacterized protein [Parasteatoda tepidariorum]|uniref:uncharacterized protein n=1 Tax=Parasteatoda tepidariorum TaxID=114398 RepID=UPI001C72097F|nr:uncharacterized protein LOC122272370 [Parasteatoda tepidariorum]